MNQSKRIGILTSGGDSPGMNAAVRAVVRTAIYFGNTIYGIRRGYQGLINGDITELYLSSVSNIIKDGGTILQTARCEEFFTKEGRQKAYESLKKQGISQLIVIGGDGSFQGLHKLLKEHPLEGIGIPGTIDNDLYGTDYTIGFDTAVNTALEAIDRIRDTATSHSRLFLVEVMGRQSGYIGLYTGIAGGAEEILIPETKTDIVQICENLKKGHKRGKQSSILVISEGDEEGNAFEIKKKIETLVDWDIRVCVLGHQQRGGSPTAFDRILASRLGYEAVCGLMNNKSGTMAGQIHTQVVFTPLKETFCTKKTFDSTYTKMAEILAT